MGNSSARIIPPPPISFFWPQMTSDIFMHGLILFCALKVVDLILIMPLYFAHYNYSCPETFRAADWDAVPSSSLERRQKWLRDFRSSAVASYSSALLPPLPKFLWVDSSEVSLSKMHWWNTQFVVSLFHRNLHAEAQDGKLTNLMRFLVLVRQLLSPAVKSLSGVNSEQATCDLLLGFYKPLSSVMH